MAALFSIRLGGVVSGPVGSVTGFRFPEQELMLLPECGFQKNIIIEKSNVEQRWKENFKKKYLF